MTITPSYVGEPECNGVIERFMRTLKEQCLYLHRFQSLADARRIIGEFVTRYNTEWLIERLGHQTPMAARTAAMAAGPMKRDRTVASGSTIEGGGAILISPSRVQETGSGTAPNHGGNDARPQLPTELRQYLLEPPLQLNGYRRIRKLRSPESYPSCFESA